MGASCYAKAIIGVVIPDQPFIEERVKAFEHSYPATWSVDPESGRPLWRTERRLRPGWTGHVDDLYDLKFNGVAVIKASGQFLAVLSRVDSRDLREHGERIIGRIELPSAAEIEKFLAAVQPTSGLKITAKDISVFLVGGGSF